MLHILASPDAAPAPSDARAAIVTVAIGEAYQLAWKRLCAGSWVAYAARCGLDLIVLTAPIDPNDRRSPAWQKLLIPSLRWARRYERLVWLDCDIIVGTSAANILDHAGPIEKVGVAPDSGRLSAAEAHVYLERNLRGPLPADCWRTAWAQAQRGLYAMSGAPPHDVHYNTGVMTLSPAHHAELLLSVYGCEERTHLCEQPHLSHLLLARGLDHRLSPRFNWGVLEALRFYIDGGAMNAEDEAFRGRYLHMLLCAELDHAWFLHFYGAMNLLHHYASHPHFEGQAQAA